jgi:hypothetical protein
MIIFAVLGAVTAYRGARTEQDAISLAEKLAQGQLIEVGERQRLRAQTVSAGALRLREEEVISEGQELAKSAAAARQERRFEDAAWLTMRSQEEFAAARAIRLIRDSFVSSELTTYQEDQRVADTLADLGFGTFVHLPGAAGSTGAVAEHPDPSGCHESTAIELSRIWCETRERLEELHEHVRISALAVAGFVLALTLFTVSDASAKARWRTLKWSFLGAGLLIGAVSFAIALVWGDTTAWPWLVGGSIATPVLWLGLHYGFAFAERSGWVHPERTDGAVHSEEVAFERAALRAPVLGHHIDHWFGIITIILIAVTVFVSAAVGWGYSVANTHADAAAEEARKSAADMVMRTTWFSARQTELVRGLAFAAERRIRLGLANQRVQFSQHGEIRGKYSDEEARHSNALRSYKGQFNDLDWIMDAAHLSAEDDPQFPNRLVWQFLRSPYLFPAPTDDASRKAFGGVERNQRSRNSYEAFARSNLESGLSVSWRNVATRLLASLTIFAICLYFLGQALAMEPTRSGYVLLTAGTIFGCFGIGSSFVSLHPMTSLVGIAQPTPKTVDAVLAENECPAFYSDFTKGPGRSLELAAYFYGVGTVLSTDNSDDSDLQRAERYFKCAVALNEGFAYARLMLAHLETRLGSLDRGETYLSLPRREKLQEIDLAQAQELLQRSGLDLSAAQREDLAFSTALNGLIRRDDKALILAESVGQEALNLIKQGKMLARPDIAALLDFNLGFVRLAKGDFAAARRSYQDGLDGQSGDEFRISPLTDFEIVRVLRCSEEETAKGIKFDCVGLRSAIVEIKKILLGKQHGESKPSSVPTLAEADFTVSATASHLLAQVKGLDPKSDGLWLIWSRMESSWNSWRTLQRMSLPINVESPRDDIVTVRDGTINVQRSLMQSYSGPRGCLGEGRYRAELYSHGTLVATRYLDRPAQRMKAARLRELNVHLCIPPEWTIVPERAAAGQQGSTYGLIRGLKDSAGNLAAFLLNFYLPTSSDGLASCLVPKNAINCAVLLMSGKAITGNEPRLNFDDRAEIPSAIDSRALFYRTWTTPDGGVHIIIAKASAGSAAQLWDMLESTEVIYLEDDMKAAAQK